MKIFDLPRTKQEVVAFLQEKGILPAERICPNNHKMKLYFSTSISWKCNVNSCRKVAIRNGNWFLGSRLSFVTAVRFFYSWAIEGQQKLVGDCDVFEALLEVIRDFWPPETQM